MTVEALGAVGLMVIACACSGPAGSPRRAAGRAGPRDTDTASTIIEAPPRQAVRLDEAGAESEEPEEPEEAEITEVADEPVETPPGRAAYEAAKHAITSGDLPSAQRHLESAIERDGEVCEYWYQLGAVEANLAVATVNADEDEAVRLFAASAERKRRALELMGESRCPIWTDDEEAQARAAAEAGLEDADAVVSDRASLVMALRTAAGPR